MKEFALDPSHLRKKYFELKSDCVFLYVDLTINQKLEQMKTLIWFNGYEFVAGTFEEFEYAQVSNALVELKGYEYDSIDQARTAAKSLNDSNVVQFVRKERSGDD